MCTTSILADDKCTLPHDQIAQLSNLWPCECLPRLKAPPIKVCLGFDCQDETGHYLEFSYSLLQLSKNWVDSAKFQIHSQTTCRKIPKNFHGGKRAVCIAYSFYHCNALSDSELQNVHMAIYMCLKKLEGLLCVKKSCSNSGLTLPQVPRWPFIVSSLSLVDQKLLLTITFIPLSFSWALALYFCLSLVSQTFDKQIQANSVLPYPCVSNICQIRSGKYLWDKGWQIFCPINWAVVTWVCFE